MAAIGPEFLAGLAIHKCDLNRGLNYGANQADAQFGGVQMLREFSFSENYLGRIGGCLAENNFLYLFNTSLC